MEKWKIALLRGIAFHRWTPIWLKRRLQDYVMRKTRERLTEALKKAANSYRFKA